MFLKTEYFRSPDVQDLQKNKILHFSLMWLLGFFIVVRLFALINFIMTLDYAEVDKSKLALFLLVQMLPPLVLGYFLRVIYLRPHKAVLVGLAVVSLFGFMHLDDPVVLTATCLLLTLIGLFYVRLFHFSNMNVVFIDPPDIVKADAVVVDSSEKDNTSH